jgi:hypothetical protein
MTTARERVPAGTFDHASGIEASTPPTLGSHRKAGSRRPSATASLVSVKVIVAAVAAAAAVAKVQADAARQAAKTSATREVTPGGRAPRDPLRERFIVSLLRT